MEGHSFKIVSNIDIDMFRKNFYYNFKSEGLIYDMIKMNDGEEFIGGTYLESKGFLIIVSSNEKTGKISILNVKKNYQIINSLEF